MVRQVLAIDEAILLALRRWRPPLMTILMKAFTRLGDALSWVFAALVLIAAVPPAAINTSAAKTHESASPSRVKAFMRIVISGGRQRRSASRMASSIARTWRTMAHLRVAEYSQAPVEDASQPRELFASKRGHRIVTQSWQQRLGRSRTLAAMKLMPTLFWLGLAAGALLASYAGLDLRLLAAGFVRIARLSGSSALSKGEQ